MRKLRITILGLLLLSATFFVSAQYRNNRSRNFGSNDPPRNGVPTWEIEPAFKKDVFTFVRIQYGTRGWGRRFNTWDTDWPDAELNLSYRLQEMTSLRANPDGVVLELTDPTLFDYPFIYIVEPGDLLFTDEEVAALRKYCLNGGFLLVDDFWGEREWLNFYEQIKRVFPEREPQELHISHQIFHCVFPLKSKPQLPSIDIAMRYQGTEITWERSDAAEVHYRAIFDDKNRIMVMICHNTDLGDGWEREGENEYYFREFSEKKAYPMGINIIFYAMTH